MSNNIAIKAENLSKAYQLGEIGTGTITRDLDRWYARIRGKEDPFIRIGEVNDRSTKGTSDIVWSLRDINFEIEKGDAVGIIGRNGAGKSTLLKILSKVTAPTSGKITGSGRIASLLEVGTGFHPELSGRENIFLNGAILGMRKHEINKKFEEIVDFSGVERYIDTPVKRYSSGMYVRLAFAVAAHLESEILIVDEVLAVGDAEFQKKCLGKMNDVSKGEGRTVLFVSHNMQSISRLCNKSMLLLNGRVSRFDQTDKIIEEYNQQEISINELTFEDGYVSYLRIEQIKNYIQLECHYQNCDDLANISFGFIISDTNSNKIFGSNDRMQPPAQRIEKSAAGVFVLQIREPKLLNGKYVLSAFLGDGVEDYFIKENVLSFEVNDMGNYTFIASAQDEGPVIPRIDWEQKITQR